MGALSLVPDLLARRCDPAGLGFATTAELVDLDAVVGQEQARTAVELAIALERDGYNLFVMGPSGSGKKSMVEQAIATRVDASGPRRSDWVYVNNFEQPHRPLAIELAAGRGAQLRDGMRRLVEDLRATIPAVFESEEYAAQAERIDAEFNERASRALQEVATEANRQGIGMIHTPSGFTFAPQKNDEVMSPEDFDKLTEDEKQRIRQAIDELQDQLVRVLRNSLRLRKEHAERVRALNQSTTLLAVEHLVEELKTAFADVPRVLGYLDAVRADVVEHAEVFRRGEEDRRQVDGNDGELRRYAVNLLLDASGADGSSVVEAGHPTYANLVGRIDHIARFGTLMTDFGLIKPGQLHRANGGYLLIDAVKLLTQPFAWSALKRALQRREVRIESLAEMYSIVSTVQLEPEPIPLRVKVVLFGERELYYLLRAFDPEFDELFHVAADLVDEFPRTDDTHLEFARVLATRGRALGLLPIEAAAVARLLDHAARLAGDATKLTACMQRLLDIAIEADHGARAAGRVQIGTADIAQAIDASRRRASRVHDRVLEAIRRGELLIDTAGSCVGQVNGLSVFELSDQGFGVPVRITATTRLGEGQVLDIQRETRLGGAIHSKGVLILSSFIAARFAQFAPYAIAASLVFEQSYGPVEGDSASLAELVALLSSIADLPLRQSIAMTGSVNQFGQVQAIGAVNEKIEGFFDVCAVRGLDGSHGVIVPRANVDHLMLREDIVAAVTAGRFAVHAVTTVDDALELLTGLPAGKPQPPWDERSVSGRVARRLREYATLRRGEPRFGQKQRKRPAPRPMPPEA